MSRAGFQGGYSGPKGRKGCLHVYYATFTVRKVIPYSEDGERTAHLSQGSVAESPHSARITAVERRQLFAQLLEPARMYRCQTAARSAFAPIRIGS